MAPLIGLNIDINVQKPTEARIARRYFEAVQAAGGVAVLMPPMSNPKLHALLPKLQGVVMIGGRDYATKHYGGDQSAPYNPLDPSREDFDLRLGRLLLREEDLPVLWICAGMQLLTILLGGKLVEHIPAWTQQMLCGQAGVIVAPDWQPVAHQDSEGKATKHPVDLVQGTLLARAYRRLHLNETVSSHHQGALVPGKGLTVSATAADGMLEGIELPDRRFCVGVQWHPEYERRSPIVRCLVRHAIAYGGL